MEPGGIVCRVLLLFYEEIMIEIKKVEYDDELPLRYLWI